eukprot:scaffold11877_cov101-Isochrysis_galbana.AAC.4
MARMAEVGKESSPGRGMEAAWGATPGMRGESFVLGWRRDGRFTEAARRGCRAWRDGGKRLRRSSGRRCARWAGRSRDRPGETRDRGRRQSWSRGRGGRVRGRSVLGVAWMAAVAMVAVVAGCLRGGEARCVWKLGWWKRRCS